MSERKVLNKYYPPDFDPSKIPRMKCAKNRQFTVRLMAPFNMRCKTCGEYIYKGKKFNARKEDVEGEDYLGIRIFRFYIKCTRCLQEISFKTDPKNTDYEIEAGATRNFMALKLAEEQAEREEEERKEEEASNPMKLLENRTQQSKMELELLESLEELRDLNKRQQSVDYDTMLLQFSSKEAVEKLAKLQEEEDDRYVRMIFGKNKRVVHEDVIDLDKEANKKKKKLKKESEDEDKSSKESQVLKVPDNLKTTVPPVVPNGMDWNRSIGSLSRKPAFGGLVRLKKPEPASSSGSSDCQTSENSTSSARPAGQEVAAVGKVVQNSALSLLGSYSGSDSNDSDSGQ